MTFQEEIREIQDTMIQHFSRRPNEMKRYENITSSIAQDHTNRWLWELLQNCDDARADQVLVYASSTSRLVLIADNGEGFKPESIDAIRGGFLSDKADKPDTIGHKGVGFKSVYSITESPRVLVVEGEGVWFDRETCVRLLRENNLPTQHPPYQWIPFLYTWADALKMYPFLESLCTNHKTVVILPYRKLETHEKVLRGVRSFTPYSLMNFRNIRYLCFINDGEKRTLCIEDSMDNILVEDTRGGQSWAEKFRRSLYNISCAQIDESVLTDTSIEYEIERIREGSISIAVACRLEDECVAPFHELPNLHVYYPTEHPSPVPILLHASFRTKSDRTAIVPISEDPMNKWIARQLAKCVVDFVQKAYDGQHPNRYLQLLRPEQVANDKDMQLLQEYILEEARSTLRIPDVSGELTLLPEQALYFPASLPRPECVRRILEKTPLHHRLVHPSLDRDSEAQQVLRRLGAQAVNNDLVMENISSCAVQNASDYEWLWNCWLYLSSLASDQRYVQKIQNLPIIPILDGVFSYEQLEQNIVSFPTEETEDLPEWMGVRIIIPRFAEIVELHMEHVSDLLQLLEVSSLQQTDIVSIIADCIDAFWEEEEGDPFRFLRFIVQRGTRRKWTARLSELKECPVPAHNAKQRDVVPARASEVYFPEMLESLNIAELCEGLRDWLFLSREKTVWEQIAGGEIDAQVRETLKQIGVQEFDPDKVEKVLRDGIKHFWQTREGDPYRFLRFIIQEEKNKSLGLDVENLGDCPVPTYSGTDQSVIFPARARETFYDEEVDGISLSSLFCGGNTGKAFICLTPKVWREKVGTPLDEKAESVLGRLGIQAIPQDEITEWLEESIEQFWQNSQGDPYRFLRFIYKAKAKGLIEPNDMLGGCPVPAYRVDDPAREVKPVKAEEVYFGEAWGHSDLERFFKSLSPSARVRDIYFLCDAETIRQVCRLEDKTLLTELFRALGVWEHPYLEIEHQWVPYKQLGIYPECSEDWRKHAFREPASEAVGNLAILKGIRVDKLSDEQVATLIQFVFRYWDYYSRNTESKIVYTHDKSRSIPIDACWWYDLKFLSEAPLQGAWWHPAPPTRCCLPGSELDRKLSPFLPVLDIDKLSEREDNQQLLRWLVVHLGVKSDVSQLSEEEWKEIIEIRMPQVFSTQEKLAQQASIQTDAFASEQNDGSKAASNAENDLKNLVKRINEAYGLFLEWKVQFAPDTRQDWYFTCPLVCEKSNSEGTYELVEREQKRSLPIYINDRPKYAKHLAIYTIGISASAHKSAAKKYLGVPTLSECLEREPIVNRPPDQTREQGEEIRQKLPYIYAIRVHNAPSSAGEVEKKLSGLEFHIDEDLKEKVTINYPSSGSDKRVLEQKEIPAQYAVSGLGIKVAIYLKQLDFEFVAKALAELLGVPTEAELYEHLLKDDEEKCIARLEEKGISKEEITSAKGKLFGSKHQLPPLEPPTREEENSITMDGESTPHTHKTETNGRRGQSIPSTLEPSGGQPGKVEGSTTTGENGVVVPKEVIPTVRLAKRRGQTLVNQGTHPSEDDTRSDPSRSLTQDQRKEIEEVGRKIVLLELQRRGFEAHEESKSNKGYDILARKGKKEYHIEVKAHLGRANKVVITQAEYIEYDKQTEGGYKWQLWNVENLEEGKTPKITIYTQIPAAALQERSFIVDLAMCWGEDVEIQTEA